MNISSETDQISDFIEKNRGKKVVVVQGLGFVGSVMALVVANSDHEDYAVILKFTNTIVKQLKRLISWPRQMNMPIPRLM